LTKKKVDGNMRALFMKIYFGYERIKGFGCNDIKQK